MILSFSKRTSNYMQSTSTIPLPHQLPPLKGMTRARHSLAEIVKTISSTGLLPVAPVDMKGLKAKLPKEGKPGWFTSDGLKVTVLETIKNPREEIVTELKIDDGPVSKPGHIIWETDKVGRRRDHVVAHGEHCS